MCARPFIHSSILLEYRLFAHNQFIGRFDDANDDLVEGVDFRVLRVGEFGRYFPFCTVSI